LRPGFSAEITIHPSGATSNRQAEPPAGSSAK
jgi:hypothetical protein